MNIVTSLNSAPHYTWGQKCCSWILVETTGLSVKQEVMPAGSKEVLHYHVKVQQFFYILKGIATFYCGDEKDTIGPHTGILIAPGTRHYIANETEHELEFLVISQPNVGNDRVNC
ncbi:MAG: cupin domain-containing protein [Bacteroidia bacterium]